MPSPRALLAVPFALVFAACAHGSEIEGLGGNGGEGVGGDGVGGRPTTSSSSSGATSTSSSGATSTSSSGATSTSSSSSSSGATSTSSSSSSSSSSSGTTCDFTAPADCTNAQTLPSVDGDQNNDTRTASGDSSEWFQVEVMEAVSSLISYPSISYTVTLTSPASTQYGLFIYEGSGSGPTCFAAAKQGSGNPATVHDSWSDTPVLDDSTWITIEVRYLSGGACGPGNQWHLTVQGNT